ncbi:MAG: hypothetical protein PUI86_07315 [Bacteroidales bacterium]|nr:hypothetical protein [Bacteroidales bacterium]
MPRLEKFFPCLEKLFSSLEKKFSSVEKTFSRHGIFSEKKPVCTTAYIHSIERRLVPSFYGVEPPAIEWNWRFPATYNSTTLPHSSLCQFGSNLSTTQETTRLTETENRTHTPNYKTLTEPIIPPARLPIALSVLPMSASTSLFSARFLKN